MTIHPISPPQAAPTTRREFISGSSALLAGITVAGVVSQSACSGGSTAQSAAAASSASGPPPTTPAVDLPIQPAVTNYSPRCWLVASDLATSGLADAASVLQWSDRTSSDFDLQYQAKIPDVNGVWLHSPPSLMLNAVNGLPAVSFAAQKSQTLIWAPGGSLDQGLDGFSAVFVCQPDTSAIYDAAYLFITHTPDQATRLGIVFDPLQGGARAIISNQGKEYNLPVLGTLSKSIPFGAPGAPIWGILSLRIWYGQNPNATLKVNGASATINLSGAATPTTPSYMDVLCSTSEINHLTCQVAEMSFYPGYLSDAQLSQIEAGLQTKYAIPA